MDVPLAPLPRSSTPTVRPGPAFPVPEDVVRLQATWDPPAVTLLLPTRPGSRMRDADARRLRDLADQARARLRLEPPSDAVDRVLAGLSPAVADAAARPTSLAAAVFVGPRSMVTMALPVAVTERVVVDPTFATRDLVRALHRTPRHAVLRLGSPAARLFEGGAGLLRPVSTRVFPLRWDGGGTDRVLDRLREVDRGLGAYLRLHPSPLVVVGSPVATELFLQVSGNLDRLAGVLPAGDGEDAAALVARIDPVLEHYLLSRQDEALSLVRRRSEQHRLVEGVGPAWLAARYERVEMLAVEQGLFYPARLSEDGDWLVPADDVEHPDVVDDVVDELIELVLRRGGWVALVDDGALADHDGVALSVRT